MTMLVLVVALVSAACGGDDEGGDSGVAAEIAEREAGGADGYSAPRAGGGGGGDESQALTTGASAVPSLGDSVVKTADLRLEVPGGEFSDAVQQIESVAPRYGGFVLSTSLDDARSKRGTIVLRVPSEDFERAVRDIKGTGEVLGEEISGRDVSQEFIDLEARITHLEAQEAVFLDLMDRATSIGETITVQNQLSGLQLDIERLQGRLNYLEDRTALGTITISVTEEGAPTPSEPNVFSTAWHDAIDILKGIGAALIIILIGVALPVGVLTAIVVFLFRQLKPRLTS